MFFLRRSADQVVTETSDVSNRLFNLLNKKTPVHTVANCLNETYLHKEIIIKKKVSSKIKLITITSFYAHKNLLIIKRIIPELEKLNLRVMFYVTIDENVFKKKFSGYERWITNYGPSDVKMCHKYYNDADAVFLPTLLECFFCFLSRGYVYEKTNYYI